MHFGNLAPEIDRWTVLRTSARWEKKIAEELADVDVPVFLPLVTRLTRYASKTQTTELPMFGGYVFCSERHFVGNQRIAHATRKQVAQVLRPPDYAILKAELEEIAAVTANHRLVQEKVYGQIGDRVVIMAGAMTGTEGKILQLRPNQRRLRLEVTFLGVLMDVELDETLVVKL
ncbi:MAG TPA: transcription termination/antitermination NusG family protein [Gemmataceae bacterium]|jgi:transcription antitermination factor NusG|nr:transcription termination/antitermination NusG family protein [Gemmataceae bacterium]